MRNLQKLFETYKAKKIEKVELALSVAKERYANNPNRIRQKQVIRYEDMIAKLEKVSLSDIEITGTIELTAGQEILDYLAEIASYTAFGNEKIYI